MDVPFPERGFAFYRNLQADGVVRLHSTTGVLTRVVDVGTALSKTGLLRTVANAIECPDLYLANINYDSFDEAIRDLNWLDFANLALILTGCSMQWANNYAAVSQLLEICADADLFWRCQGRRLLTVIVD
jgi:hypothetical protein